MEKLSTYEADLASNLSAARGYHHRVFKFYAERRPASLIFNVAAVSIEYYLVALCAKYQSMPLNHNYSSLIYEIEQVFPEFPEKLKVNIQRLDKIFGICSIDDYYHGTPNYHDTDNAMSICIGLKNLFDI